MLLEAFLAMGVVCGCLLLITWMLSLFYGGKLGLQSAASNLRSQVDELALAIVKDTRLPCRAFVFDGRLVNADSTNYTCAPLGLSKSIVDVEDASDFLAASGLGVDSTTAGKYLTVLVVNDPLRPMMFTRSTETRADGWTNVTIEWAGSIPRNEHFAFPSDCTPSELAKITGQAIQGTDGSVALEMPNPLALPSALLPQDSKGTIVHFLPIRTRHI